ncbi:MAG TPA: DUF2459 domain-containing protein [Methylomirabilota bacterium]|jgi:uncharacterized protein (TIGR02117 family)
MWMARLTVVVFFLEGCASPAVYRETPVTCEPSHGVFVVSHGWHSGIVINTHDLVKLLPPLAADIGEAGLVEVGWGEERFYQAASGTSGMALRALLRPNASVLHVVPLARPPRESFPGSDIVEVWMDEAGYEATLAFVARSFTRATEGGLLRLGPSLYGGGWFYRAEGSFHAFNTCHTWVARAIENRC